MRCCCRPPSWRQRPGASLTRCGAAKLSRPPAEEPSLKHMRALLLGAHAPATALSTQRGRHDRVECVGRGSLLAYVRFSNRPFGVKRFQALHHSSVDVAHGLVLLFGLGTKALPSWDSKTRWNNL